MANSSALIDCVSVSLDLSRTWVATSYRYLREAGIQTKTGRGTSAALMRPTDAANLLIAAVASPNVKDSAATVTTHALAADALASDIERAMAGHPPQPSYEFRRTSGAAFWVSGFTGAAVQAVADLLSR